MVYQMRKAGQISPVRVRCNAEEINQSRNQAPELSKNIDLYWSEFLSVSSANAGNANLCSSVHVQWEMTVLTYKSENTSAPEEHIVGERIRSSWWSPAVGPTLSDPLRETWIFVLQIPLVSSTLCANHSRQIVLMGPRGELWSCVYRRRRSRFRANVDHGGWDKIEGQTEWNGCNKLWDKIWRASIHSHDQWHPLHDPRVSAEHLRLSPRKSAEWLAAWLSSTFAGARTAQTATESNSGSLQSIFSERKTLMPRNDNNLGNRPHFTFCPSWIWLSCTAGPTPLWSHSSGTELTNRAPKDGYGWPCSLEYSPLLSKLPAILMVNALKWIGMGPLPPIRLPSDIWMITRAQACEKTRSTGSTVAASGKWHVALHDEKNEKSSTSHLNRGLSELGWDARIVVGSLDALDRCKSYEGKSLSVWQILPFELLHPAVEDGLFGIQQRRDSQQQLWQRVQPSRVE